jgi:4,5-DOPA dioxygenase extradiol
MIEYQAQGPSAELAINSAEHYKPLLYVLGATRPGESVRFFAEKVTLGSISMRAFIIG